MQSDAPDQITSERENQLQRLEEIRSALAEARRTGNWEQVPDEVYRDYLNKVILTSAPSLANYRDFKELDFLTAETLFALDIADQLTDTAQEIEQLLAQASETVLERMRDRALRINADAVISLDIKHVLLDATGSTKQFAVIATGTAVQFD